MPPIKKKDTITTHRVHEHELLQRLERLCETAALELMVAEPELILVTSLVTTTPKTAYSCHHRNEETA
jgi:hypothetical protein